MVSAKTGRKRPRVLRALGNQEPPTTVAVDGTTFYLREIFKHDSWAATARYGDGGPQPDPGLIQAVDVDTDAPMDRRSITCKFNRQAPIGIISMKWLGKFLALREHYFLATLAGIEGIPEVYNDIRVEGQPAPHAVAHVFIPGKPLSLCSDLGPDFFEQVHHLIAQLHDHSIVYIDLHKAENVIVGDDGRPHLIDFQVSLQVPAWPGLGLLFRVLKDCDLYHLSKHRGHHRVPGIATPRPWLIQAHRAFAIPLRECRRRLLVLMGVRRGSGSPATEIAPEIGLRRS